MTRYARRVDRNHAAIRDGLRQVGYKVFDCSRLGGGFPDLLAWDGKRLTLLEVKMPGEYLTIDEELFHKVFPVAVVRNVDEAIEACTGGEHG